MIDPLYIGAFGATLILFAFVLGQLHVWKDTYFIYDLLNAVGSSLLVYYALAGRSWPFVVLNTVWAIVSLKDVVGDLRRNARRKSSLGPWSKWME